MDAPEAHDFRRLGAARGARGERAGPGAPPSRAEPEQGRRGEGQHEQRPAAAAARPSQTAPAGSRAPASPATARSPSARAPPSGARHHGRDEAGRRLGRSRVAKAAGATTKAKKPSMPSHSAIETTVKVLMTGRLSVRRRGDGSMGSVIAPAPRARRPSFLAGAACLAAPRRRRWRSLPSSPSCRAFAPALSRGSRPRLDALYAGLTEAVKTDSHLDNMLALGPRRVHLGRYPGPHPGGQAGSL